MTAYVPSFYDHHFVLNVKGSGVSVKKTMTETYDCITQNKDHYLIQIDPFKHTRNYKQINIYNYCTTHEKEKVSCLK